jgi:hypothetical protein
MSLDYSGGGGMEDGEWWDKFDESRRDSLVDSDTVQSLLLRL